MPIARTPQDGNIIDDIEAIKRLEDKLGVEGVKGIADKFA